jgi:hypothetical protein
VLTCPHCGGRRKLLALPKQTCCCLLRRQRDLTIRRPASRVPHRPTRRREDPRSPRTADQLTARGPRTTSAAGCSAVCVRRRNRALPSRPNSDAPPKSTIPSKNAPKAPCSSTPCDRPSRPQTPAHLQLPSIQTA